MNPIDDASTQDGPQLGAPMAEDEVVTQPSPARKDLFAAASPAPSAPDPLAVEDLPAPAGSAPGFAPAVLGLKPAASSAARSPDPVVAGNVYSIAVEGGGRSRANSPSPMTSIDPLDATSPTMEPANVRDELMERASVTQDTVLADNYLSGLEADFESALEQVPGLDDDQRALALALFKHHIIMSVAANPSKGSDLESLNQIRLIASNRSASGFSSDWTRFVSSVDEKSRDSLVVVHDLAANLYRSHDSKLVTTMERLASRNEGTGATHSSGAVIASGLGSVVGGLTAAGSRFFTEMRRQIDKGLKQHRSSKAEDDSPSMTTETVDVDVKAWRSAKAAALALDVQRLVSEFKTKAGDIDWENGRGQEAAADLKLAVDGLGEMAEEGALEQVQSDSVKQVLSEAAVSMDESEKRMRTAKLRDLVSGLSAAITNLASRVLDSVRSIAKSVTGTPDDSPTMPPAQGDAEAKSLEPQNQPQHHARKMPRP